jgi:hypothetical protein
MSSPRRGLSERFSENHQPDRQRARYGDASKHGYEPRLNDDVKSSEPQGVTTGVSIPISNRNRRSICLPLLA